MKKWLIIALLILLSGCTSFNNSNQSSECDDTISYTDWSDCNITGYQTRTKIITSCVNNSIFQTNETRECTPVCSPNWECSEWSACNSTGNQTRTCVDYNSCNSDYNKPSEIQFCTFNNPCSSISDSLLLAKCNSIVYNKAYYCQSLNNVDNKETCLAYYAETRSNISACELIDDSFNRNTCKARTGLDFTYCDILAPSYRSACEDLVDSRLLDFALINKQSSYCTNIKDASVKSDCLDDDNFTPHETFMDDVSNCNDYTYSESSGTYQTIRACYVYHITNSGINCSSVPNFMQEDCNAMVSNNLTFCYDQSGTSRDWCLANMAFYNNDSSLCRDATSEDNCLHTVGYQLKAPYFCNQISDESTKVNCIDLYISYCQSDFYNCYPSEYCNLKDNDDDCIFGYVEGLYYYEDETWS